MSSTRGCTRNELIIYFSSNKESATTSRDFRKRFAVHPPDDFLFHQARERTELLPMLRHRRGMRIRWCRQLRRLPIREPSRPTLRRDRRRVRCGTGGQSPITAGEYTRSTHGRKIGVAAAASDRRREVHPRYSPVCID